VRIAVNIIQNCSNMFFFAVYKKAMVDVRIHPGVAHGESLWAYTLYRIRVVYVWLLCANVTSSTKSEVYRGTENVRLENAGHSKMHGRKMLD